MNTTAALSRARRRALYAEDRELLLWAASYFFRRTYRRPIEALANIFELTGFALERNLLPDHQWGLTDFKERTVSICKDLAIKLSYRRAAGAVQAFTAAHELAHLRLHSHLTTWGKREEDEADEYAGVFLMPAHQLRACPEWERLLQAQSPGWLSECVDRLAAQFGVSRTAMLVELRILRVVHQVPSGSLALCA